MLIDRSRSCGLALLNGSEGPGTTRDLAATYVGIRNLRGAPTFHLACPGNAKWAEVESSRARFHLPEERRWPVATHGALQRIFTIIVFTGVLVLSLLL